MSDPNAKTHTFAPQRPTPDWTVRMAHSSGSISTDSTAPIRTFETGATRDTDAGKPDYEAFFSPLVFEAFGEYMDSHRVQADGTVRAGDNWQKGIPLDAYMKSLWRHFMDLWMLHRGIEPASGVGQVEALMACLFNIQGYAHELLKGDAE